VLNGDTYAKMHRTHTIVCGWCSITAGLVMCESALTIWYLNLMLDVMFNRLEFEWGGGALLNMHCDWPLAVPIVWSFEPHTA
jgi:hypothetical protein